MQAQGDNPTCVFWDFDIQDWSEEGCQLAEYKKLRVTCHCNHLTNFAVLIVSCYQIMENKSKYDGYSYGT